MLRPGGMLLYSTCTFDGLENEGTIGYLLEQYPEFTIEGIRPYEGFCAGMPGLWKKDIPDLKKTVRIFPHKMKGEGHYIALLRKNGEHEMMSGGSKKRPKKLAEELEAFLRPETRAVVITGASNVTGNVTDLSYISSFVKQNGLLLIVDASQTAGEELFSVQKLGIDVLCFTGHKALLGPQGTGGLYVKPGLSVEPLLVGGSGIHSYDEHHPKEMPTALEAGTLNVHGLAGLAAGIRYRMDQGIEKLQKRERDLTRHFYEQVKEIPGIIVYGAPAEKCHAPIVSLNLAGEDSARVADALWEEYGICVRAGAHCAPLMHRAIGTVGQGVVRVSFSHFNTEEEIERAAEAVRALAEEA